MSGLSLSGASRVLMSDLMLWGLTLFSVSGLVLSLERNPLLMTWHLTPGAWIYPVMLTVSLYIKRGHSRYREQMINSIAWRGDEVVLDVDIGHGMLLIDVAKRLTTGTLCEIDIRRSVGLQGTFVGRIDLIAQREGVADKMKMREGDARTLDFPGATFDVVLSDVCFHRIYTRADRAQACREIVRVLKPVGTILVSDTKNTHEYASIFREAGLQVQISNLNWWSTLSPLRVVRAQK